MTAERSVPETVTILADYAKPAATVSSLKSEDSTEQLICKSPQVKKTKNEHSVTSKSVEAGSDGGNRGGRRIVVFLGLGQVVLGALLVGAGACAVVKGAALSRVGAGLWAGSVAVVAGVVGVLAGINDCYGLNGANNRSDSECETILPKKSTVASKKLKTVPTTSAKRKPMTSTSSKCNKRPKTNVFGLYSDREDSTPRDSKAVSTRLLPSYIVTKVGGGAERRCHPTSGEFYVELKVFTREDAECPETDERWKKALLRLHCLLEDDSTQWEHLQRFVKDASLLFQEAEPAFYSEKMNVKR